MCNDRQSAADDPTTPARRESGQPAHIVSFAAVTWDFPLIGRTRMLTEAWLSAGQPTTFIEPPHSYRSRLKQVLLGPQSPPHVLRPAPTRYPVRCWKRMNPDRLRRMLRAGARALRRRLESRFSWDDAIALVITPMWLPWLEELPFRTVVYDCIDDLSVHAPDPAFHRIYKPWEGELIDRCDGAMATAETLAGAIRARRPNLPVTLIRNGVDVDRFRALGSGVARPGDLPSADRPIIGFVGALYEWVDWPLIRHAATHLPEADFVFVGPYGSSSEIAQLESFKNVTFLGARAYDEVPAYVSTFDVCWVPFRVGGIAAAANPIKIYEYLALGRPVVSTPVADTDGFEGLVRVGRTAGEVTDLLREALAATPADTDRRVAFARRNSWDDRAAEIVEFLDALKRRAG